MSDGPGRDLTVLFGLCDTGRGVPQVLKLYILIVWTQLKAVGLEMLSAGYHLGLLRSQLSIIRPITAISEEPLTARNRL